MLTADLECVEEELAVPEERGVKITVAKKEDQNEKIS